MKQILLCLKNRKEVFEVTLVNNVAYSHRGSWTSYEMKQYMIDFEPNHETKNTAGET